MYWDMVFGQQEVFKSQPNNGDFIGCLSHYNVGNDDPEAMRKPSYYIGSDAKYHLKYLIAMLNERKIKYKKKDVSAVCNSDYIEELKKRTNHTQHLRSLEHFFNVCRNKLS